MLRSGASLCRALEAQRDRHGTASPPTHLFFPGGHCLWDLCCAVSLQLASCDRLGRPGNAFVLYKKSSLVNRNLDERQVNCKLAGVGTLLWAETVSIPGLAGPGEGLGCEVLGQW